MEPKNADFQTMEYWDRRYMAEPLESDFDWFRKYSDIVDIVHELIPNRASRILMLGCGNSNMYNDGYQNILNLDYSSVLIEKMRTRAPQMQWKVMDIRYLREHADQLGGLESWDVIIDKGTMDALMAENASVWNPSDQVLDNVAREVDGVLALLKQSTGLFLYFTFGQPHFRLPHMQRPNWTLTKRELGDMFHYYLYIGQKAVN
ncbi:hypothetical protein MPSI1_003814 [Malassezia psittaci]|uniref:Methyltransferase domain-containing protein n=1 Tax=Malassezia psittaci TaxID=1821823 RepID=A0AAF0FD23_9BASI|nr:hypothetical protein MPSI1_003814 [Malassezia psittaci]